jgi:hypothetical protein
MHKLLRFSFQKGWLHLSHLAWDLPSKTCYWRKDIGTDWSDGKTRKKTRQLLGDLKEMKRYCKLQQKAADRTVRGTRFHRGYGPVARQATEWMNESIIVLGHFINHGIIWSNLKMNRYFCHFHQPLKQMNRSCTSSDMAIYNTVGPNILLTPNGMFEADNKSSHSLVDKCGTVSIIII